MSPPTAAIAQQLRQLIYYHLDNDMEENALFLAGRLHALDPRNPDGAHLLALCNLRLGRLKAAYDHSKEKGGKGAHLGCAYTFAQACLGLEKNGEGICALDRARGLWAARNHWNKHSEISRRHVPDAAACNRLLGKLYNAQGDTAKAMHHYIHALKANPFMWDAFTDLCDTGAVVRPSNVFKMSTDMISSLSDSGVLNGNDAFLSQQRFVEPKNPFISTPDIDPFNPSTRTGGDVGLNLGGSNLLSRLNGKVPVSNANGTGSHHLDVETPTSNGQIMHEDDVMIGDVGRPAVNEHEPPQAPGRKARVQAFTPSEEPPRMRSITSRSRLKTGSESTDATDIPRPVGQNGHKRTVSGHSMPPSEKVVDPTAAPPRRSVRLLNSISSQIRPSSSRLAAATSRDTETRERRELRKKATGTKGRATSTTSASTVGRVVSGNRKATVEIAEPAHKQDSRQQNGSMAAPPPRMGSVNIDNTREREALQWLLDLMLKLGTGYSHLSHFRCLQALEAFDSIPVQQRETPWVLAQIGKAYYERSMYTQAEEIFQRIQKLAPARMEDMEVYSNVLWQLKKDTELSYLAHVLVEQDRLSPQAWCAIGNAFSLQREHDQAIKCFTRATQLNPKFAYAFTLQGHEHVANEEFDKAMFSYRCAVNADHRHYNGWYGLGQVYEKLGKFDVAEQHYRAAAQINPTNALLAVKIGSVLDRMKKTQPALVQYIHAVSLDPRSNLARFRKAQSHLKLHNPTEALKELKILKDLAPDDANVHFLLGRTYKRLRDRTNAIRHFTIALNLDPKASQYIKENMESLEEDEEFSSDEDR
ncbi:TPR-like protein [Delitschia confertaspora ATCC 74209]|uniref:TPR-like protein n=1 Tax=Delitschia confertaspora ATCC 74209 TaxID=1513339 RepID=A0A9P4MPX1_9PLEO|nr:TPR-like protein [Delitschia confertaspora ATCC 74209]